ncbi:MAG: hypothetical protein KKE62_01705 [Proteobacteria bacterium]|nr:hypothetical protein [Pseudomonadota bacterium]MBU1387147.1 hypothetical protein [Pseudomonadota bacterium]MBU1541536.1 hypothetical protein [Pseudomonadota bacterium]MBU2481841.1 hypothetical protein [Pseudomonadota bacterium]
MNNIDLNKNAVDADLMAQMVAETEKERAEFGHPETEPLGNVSKPDIPVYNEEDSTPQLPIINVSENPMHVITDLVLEEHLSKTNLNIYQRNNYLVQILRDDNGRPYIHEITNDQLRGILDRVIHFEKTTSSGVDYTLPPTNIIRDILSLKNYPDSIPQIRGIAESPVVRISGTIVCNPGYDSQSQYFYWPDKTIPSIDVSEHPTGGQIRDSVDLLTDILTDFPFVDNCSLCNAIALMITPIVRPAIDGIVPLALIESTQKGTGKGLLTSLIHLIATGKMPQTLTMPGSEGEIRRQITSACTTGKQIRVYDNVDRIINSPAFASALTTSEWADRTLGKTEIRSYPNNTTWIMNGNNIRLGGDISRRCYVIQLDPKNSRPWQRSDFKYKNLLLHIKKNRSALLSAILTLVRAWFDAGQPVADVPTMGSFEEWTRVVGGVLHNAGLVDFLSNLEILYQDADDESNQYEHFLQAWHEHFGTREVTAKEICQSRLVEFLPESVLGVAPRSGNLTQKVGKMLSKFAGTRFGPEGYHLVKLGFKNHSLIWQVKKEDNP